MNRMRRYINNYSIIIGDLNAKYGLTGNTLNQMGTQLATWTQINSFRIRLQVNNFRIRKSNLKKLDYFNYRINLKIVMRKKFLIALRSNEKLNNLYKCAPLSPTDLLDAPHK